MDRYLSYYTTGKKETEGKLKIMVCYHESESDLFVRYARTALMRYCNDSVLYYPKNDGSISRQQGDWLQFRSLVGEMDGLFICVTKALITDKTSLARLMLETAIEMNISVLPFFCEPALYDAWNAFMPIQAIDPFNTDPTQINYHTKISDWIDRITPLSEDVVEKIWKNFDYRFFLSYRKLDRKYVDTVMRSVHGRINDRYMGFAGIWYDEALTSDDNYNTIIENKIVDSDLVLMLISPNTFLPNSAGEVNYVLREEYPAFVREKKDIIGILAPGTDASLAMNTFKAIKYFVFLEEEGALNEALSRIELPDSRVKEKTSEVAYHMGLAYLKGVGAEVSIDNAVMLFMYAIKQDGHVEATRRLVEIGFDENEKMKGEDGYYDPGTVSQYALKLFEAAVQRADQCRTDETIKEAFDEVVPLIRRMKKCGDEWPERAMQMGRICLDWVQNILVTYADTDFTRSLEGEVLIEIGEAQYLRHIFRGHNPQGRELGAIAYLPDGIERMRRRPGVLSIKEVDILTQAYDYLADSYYRQGAFGNQRRTLAEKIDFVEKYADNEMDGLQLLEQADTRFLLAEACMMGTQDMLDSAMSYFEDGERYLDDAKPLCNEFQIVKRRIKLYIALGNTFLCKMDITRDRSEALEWKRGAYAWIDEAQHLAERYLERSSEASEKNYIEYLLGRVYLIRHRAYKIDRYKGDDLIRAAANLIVPYAQKNRDYDTLHDYYRVELEILSANMRYVFVDSATTDADLVRELIDAATGVIDEIQNEVRQHNDYWIALDRLELWIMKTQILVLALRKGVRYPAIIRDIEECIYVSESHCKNILNKEGTDKSRVLLGSMDELSVICQNFYQMIGNQEAMLEWHKTACRVIEDIKESALNDYMK